MLSLEQLSHKVSELEREVKSLKKDRTLAKQEYLSPAQVKVLYNRSAKTLYRYRKLGLLTDFRMSVKGTGFEYSAHQLENVFKVKSIHA